MIKSFVRCLLVLASAGGSCFSQIADEPSQALPARTALTVTAVGNAANFQAPVAPGSLATVFGTDLATGTSAPSSLPFPTTFNGVSVSVAGRPAPITYLSPTQINFQVPYATPPGNASLTVTTGGQTSAAVQFTVRAAAPAIFEYGTNRGIVQNQDGSLNGADNPAAAGSAVVVYLTGIGATSPAVADGAAAPAALVRASGTSTASIGGRDAAIAFLGLTPGNVGLAQANLVVPAGLTSGDHPLTITLAGQTSKSVLVSMRAASTGGGGGGDTGGLPEGAKCVSGNVDYVLFSDQGKLSRLADEVSIGGTKLCEKCDLKPPLYGNFAEKIEQARLEGLNVDACYDGFGTLNYLRMRQ